MAQKTIQTTCSYCSVGCNFDVQVENGSVVKMIPSDYVVNEKKACPKGFNLDSAMLNDQRLLHPLVRDGDGTLQKTDWDSAIDTFTARIKAIQEKHGRDSVAFISTGQMPTEEMALLGAVARIGMGTHGDGNTRQCMASAVVGYKQAFGFDAPPFTYEDIAESDCVVFVGANPVIAHPVIWNHFKKNSHSPQVIVIDPRRTQTAAVATQHIVPRLKTDLVLLYTVANVLVSNDWIEPSFIQKSTKGFEDFKSHIAAFTLDKVEDATGVPAAEVEKMARSIHESKRVSLWWTMGVNQSHQGVRTVQAIINIALMTGNIGRIGTGANSLTGQANAMGSRLHSFTTGMYGARDFADGASRDLMGRLLDIDPGRLPKAPTKPYHKIIEGVKDHSIKALWFICTNPLHSWVDLNDFKKSIKNLDLLVVQDLWEDTASAQYADIIFPAAGSLEKDGFFINSERRLGITDKAVEPLGNSLPDFEIFKRVAKSYGCYDVIKNIDTVDKIFHVLKESTRGTPCDITGLKDREDLRAKRGIQWPYTEEIAKWNPGKSRRLFEDGKFYTPDGKAKFLFEDFQEAPETVDDRYPLRLITGRGTVLQFHTQTRTQRSPRLQKDRIKDAYCEINETEAQKFDLKDNDRVLIESRRGSCTVKVFVTDSSLPGYVFMPMHYVESNIHTMQSFDPYSAQPSFKIGAVSIQKVS